MNEFFPIAANVLATIVVSVVIFRWPKNRAGMKTLFVLVAFTLAFSLLSQWLVNTLLWVIAMMGLLFLYRHQSSTNGKV
jgi:hypothetical protein